ncbi:MAG: hypothetical protein FJ267_18380, partial [Planctomycetes bacterium]|nr:hypothetical protein [Planctomycetota bacterium]
MENNNSLSQTRRDKHFPCDFWIAVLAVFLLSHFSTLASSAEPLEVQLQSITRLPRYQHSHWGMMFIDLESDEIIYQEQPEKLFAPASVTKLFSVACLIDTFGIDHRFQTNVVRKGDVNDGGLLKGDLILIASGDLSFGGRTTPTGEIAFANADHTYANGNSEAQITPHDPLSGLNDLAQQVFQSGIRSIEGDVLVDDRLFEHIESTGSGPQRVTPIMINDNLIDLKIEPTSQGQPAKLTIRPESKSVS